PGHRYALPPATHRSSLLWASPKQIHGDCSVFCGRDAIVPATLLEERSPITMFDVEPAPARRAEGTRARLLLSWPTTSRPERSRLSQLPSTIIDRTRVS